MKKYKLHEFLEAAKPFAKQPGAQEDMERILREIESAKQKIPEKDVTIVSEKSIYEGINELCACSSQLYIAIMLKFAALGYKPIGIETPEIKSHFGFGEHWNELPEYAGYVPEQYHQSWRWLESAFYSSEKYGPENPLPVNIKKGDTVIVVNVYGFKNPEIPPVICLGTDAATRGRVVLCKTVTTREFVAIAW